MKDQDSPTNPALEPLDPCAMQDSTESGELERPQLRRKIDCAAAPETPERTSYGSGGSRTHHGR